MWPTDASSSCRKGVSWVSRVTVARERRRRKRKTSALTDRYGDVATTQAKSHPLGGRGQWSTCSSTRSRLIGSALRGYRMGRSRKPSPCDGISFQGDRLVWLVIDPLGTRRWSGFDLITGPSLSPSSEFRIRSPSNLATATYLHPYPLPLVLMLGGPSPGQIGHSST
jgi:hypothetical protein